MPLLCPCRAKVSPLECHLSILRTPSACVSGLFERANVRLESTSSVSANRAHGCTSLAACE
eukprot:2914628-Prymnesium_polylepis.2